MPKREITIYSASAVERITSWIEDDRNPSLSRLHAITAGKDISPFTCDDDELGVLTFSAKSFSEGVLFFGVISVERG